MYPTYPERGRLRPRLIGKHCIRYQPRCSKCREGVYETGAFTFVSACVRISAVITAMPTTYLVLCILLISILIFVLTRPRDSICININIGCSSTKVRVPAEEPWIHQGLQPILPVSWQRSRAPVFTLFIDPEAELAQPSVIWWVINELSIEKIWVEKWRKWEKRREMMLTAGHGRSMQGRWFTWDTLQVPNSSPYRTKVS